MYSGNSQSSDPSEKRLTLVDLPFEIIELIEAKLSGLDSIKMSHLSYSFLQASLLSTQWENRIKNELSLGIYNRSEEIHRHKSQYLRRFYNDEYKKEKDKVRSKYQKVMKDYNTQRINIENICHLIEIIINSTNKTHLFLGQSDRTDWLQRYQASSLHAQYLMFETADNIIYEILSETRYPIYGEAREKADAAYFELCHHILKKPSNNLTSAAIFYRAPELIRGCNVSNKRYKKTDDIHLINILDIHPSQIKILFQSILDWHNMTGDLCWDRAEFIMTYAIQTKNDALRKVLMGQADINSLSNQSDNQLPLEIIEAARLYQRFNARYRDITYIFDIRSNHTLDFKLNVFKGIEPIWPVKRDYPAIANSGIGFATWAIESCENEMNASISSKSILVIAHILFAVVSLIVHTVLAPISLTILFLSNNDKLERMSELCDLGGHLVIHKILFLFADTEKQTQFSLNHFYALRAGWPGMLIGVLFAAAFAIPILTINFIKHSILSSRDAFLFCFDKKLSNRTDKQKFLAGGLGYLVAIVPAMLARVLYEGYVKISDSWLTRRQASETLPPFPIEQQTAEPREMHIGSSFQVSDLPACNPMPASHSVSLHHRRDSTLCSIM